MSRVRLSFDAIDPSLDDETLAGGQGARDDQGGLLPASGAPAEDLVARRLDPVFVGVAPGIEQVPLPEDAVRLQGIERARKGSLVEIEDLQAEVDPGQTAAADRLHDV